jgi:hypothetical protein
MTLTVQELTQAEELALVSLLKLIIRADKQLSGAEHDEVRKLATMMSQQRFADRVAEAQQLFSNQSEVKEHALTLQRQGARELIFSILYRLAESDGISLEEETLLAWLHEVWGLAGADPA